MNFTPVLLRQSLLLGISETVLIQLMNFTTCITSAGTAVGHQ